MTTYLLDTQSNTRLVRLPLSSHSRHITIPIGTKYGNLTIISEPFRIRGKRRVFYECQCKCGKMTEVRSDHLKLTKSCGCICFRDGPRKCKVCGKTESEVPFPKKSATLYCSTHSAIRYRKIRAKARQKWLADVESSPEKCLRYAYTRLRGAKRSDRRISVDDLLVQWKSQKGKCAITGIKLSLKRKTIFSVSIDRIDSSKAYELGNIQLVCYGANLAKNSFSNEEAINFFTAVRDQSCA